MHSKDTDVAQRVLVCISVFVKLALAVMVTPLAFGLIMSLSGPPHLLATVMILLSLIGLYKVVPAIHSTTVAMVAKLLAIASPRSTALTRARSSEIDKKFNSLEEWFAYERKPDEFARTRFRSR